MSPVEYDLWYEEYRANPWGEQRDQLHVAHIAQVIGNYAGKVRTESLDLATAHASLAHEIHKTLNPTAEPTGPDPESFFKQFNL